MLIMAGSFGLWRAGIVTSAWFTAGVAAIVAVLAGATTWATDGFWAPDGAYSLVVSPAIAFIWIVATTGHSSQALRQRPAGDPTPSRHGT